MSDHPATEYCYIHPTVETTLHCNRCERPICSKCAVLTPTGYRCRECVRGQQKIFSTAMWYDYPLAFLAASILSFIGSLIVTRLGFFTIFLAPIAGVIVAEAARLIVGRRRSKSLFQLTTLAAALGCLPMLLITVLPVLAYGRAGLGSLLGLVWFGIYAFTVTTTVYYRLSGIRMSV